LQQQFICDQLIGGGFAAGFESNRQKTLPSYKSAPVVALTCSSSAKDAEMIFDALIVDDWRRRGPSETCGRSAARLSQLFTNFALVGLSPKGSIIPSTGGDALRVGH
jgi:hypothetical protein